MRACVLLVCAAACWGLSLLGAPAAAAAGRWTTVIRPTACADVEAGGDSVWFATANAGLQLYERGTGGFRILHRFPDSLASNNLSALARDRSRRLWIGTRDAGLVRLDPDGRWRVLNAFDGLPSDGITVVKAYGDTVWIGTDEGIAFWNGLEISGRLPDGVNPSPFASDQISGVVMSGDSVWVATLAGIYLGRMSQGLAAWSAENAGLGTTVVSGLVSDGGTLLALAGNTPYVRTGGTWTSAPGAGVVWRIDEDGGVVLASGGAGLFRWQAPGWTLIDGTMTSEAAGATWVAALAPDGALFAADVDGPSVPAAGGGRARIAPEGPPGNNILNLASDGTRLYYNARGAGIGRFDGTSWLNWPARLCTQCDREPWAPSEPMGLLIDRQGRVWFGTWTSAIDVLDDSGPIPAFTHHWTGDLIAEDRHTWTWSSAVDDSGGVWIGMDTPSLGSGGDYDPIGLEYYRPDGTYGRNYNPDSAFSSGMLGLQVRALELAESGRMWVGYGSGGVNWFTPPAVPGSALDFGSALLLPTADALDVFGLAAYGDSLWVLSSDSLRLLRSGRLTAYPKLGAVPAPAPHPIDVGADGTVFLGSDLGLRAIRPGGTIVDFTTRNSPLADDVVRSVFAEPGTNAVWIGTANGLNRLDIDYAPPPVEVPEALRVRVWPNPVSLTGLGFALRLSGEGTSYRGAVYGIDGRRLRDLAVSANGAVAWDGRDETGALVRPGVYFLRVEAGGRRATARVVVLR